MICKTLAAFLVLFSLSHFPATAQTAAPPAEDSELLLKIQKDSFQYFVRMSDKVTGLTRDSSQPGSPASVAATGFSLAAFTIAHHHGWIDRDYAYQYLEKTLKTLLSKAEHERGFFYHFLDTRTGKRVWGSEASSIDTALLVAGALLAGQYFPGTAVEKMAERIYQRIDWLWMMNGTSLMCMGWKPDTGFLPYYWDSYSEHLILQAFAIGSPTHPIPSEAWHNWFRNEDVYRGKSIIFSHSGSLFTYQYSQAYIDFRNLDDRGINYFENSRAATIANWEYSKEHQAQFQSYSENFWGLSASLGPGGYKAYGGKPGEGLHDGTIAPYAAIGSILFTPHESTATIKNLYSKYFDKIYGHFGFRDAFNLDKNWWSQDYLGIDQGIIVLALENYLNEELIWEKFMRLDAIQKWIKLCELSAQESVP